MGVYMAMHSNSNASEISEGLIIVYFGMLLNALTNQRMHSETTSKFSLGCTYKPLQKSCWVYLATLRRAYRKFEKY